MHSVQRIGERHSIEYHPHIEILTQDHAHLPEAGECPDLWASLVGEQVLPDAPQGLDHDGPVTRGANEQRQNVLQAP